MSGGWGDHCIATFKNKRLTKYLSRFIAVETYEEEWDEQPDPENSCTVCTYLGRKGENNKRRSWAKNIVVRTINLTYIDLAKLYGFRKTCLWEKGDKRLTKKEAKKIVRTFNYGKHYFPVGKGRLTAVDEKYIRLVSAYFHTDDDGITTISFDEFAIGEALSVLRVASLKFPKTKIKLEELHEYWDSEEYSKNAVYYEIKNGESKCVDHISEYEDYTDHDEIEGEEN